LLLLHVMAQGVRATTAAGAPAPADVVAGVLDRLGPQLGGQEGAVAAELAAVLRALAALSWQPEPAWLAAALDGAADKLHAAAAASPGGETAVVGVLDGLAQLLSGAEQQQQQLLLPEELLDAAVAALGAAQDRLGARDIATALAALRALGTNPGDGLMHSFLSRAADAVVSGGASPADAADTLASLAAAGVVPGAVWLREYLVGCVPLLPLASGTELAVLARGAAELVLSVGDASSTNTNSSSSSSHNNSSVLPPAPFLDGLVAVIDARLGTGFADAARILSAAEYRPPLSLPQLADVCWAALRLGSPVRPLRRAVSLLLSKSYDRLSLLSPTQITGAAWAIAAARRGSSGSSSSSSDSSLRPPSKWLNQLCAAAAPGVPALTGRELSELTCALEPLLLGAVEGYLGGSAPDAAATAGSMAGNTSAAAAAAGAAAASSTAGAGGTVGVSSAIGRSSEVPVQPLLRALSARLDAALSNTCSSSSSKSSSSGSSILAHSSGSNDSRDGNWAPSADEVAVLVKLAARFGSPASRRTLLCYCDDIARDWDSVPSAALVNAADALAVLIAPGAAADVLPAGWLPALAAQVDARLAHLSLQQCCRLLWSLTTLGAPLSRSWLERFAAATFSPAAFTAAAAASMLQPGDLVDGLWGLQTADRQQQQQDSGGMSSDENAAVMAAEAEAAPLPLPLLSAQLMGAAAVRLERRLQELSGSQVLRLLQLALGAAAPPVSYSLPRGVTEQLSQVLSSRAATAMESTGAAGLLWACAQLGLRLHITTLDSVCKRIYAQLATLSPGEVARAVWASERLGYR
jgi:hypothetical protein